MPEFLFDIDGTLTPSRTKIDLQFGNWMEHFATHSACYWVTGSPKYMTERQLGGIYNLAIRSYQCSGTDVWQQNTNIRRSDWKLPDLAKSFLLQTFNEETFDWKCDPLDCIHERPGMVNYSVIGSCDDKNQRELFINWEETANSRSKTADAFNILFPELQASVGGETGIDIGPMGSNKSQILSDFDISKVIFFGDKTEEGGNDHEIAEAVKAGGGKVYAVNGWEETWKILKEL